MHDIKGDGARPHHRDARPRLLPDGQHHAAPAVGACSIPTGTLFKPKDAAAAASTASLSVDYMLKKEAQKVTVGFLDGKGQVIRTLSGTAEDAERSRR